MGGFLKFLNAGALKPSVVPSPDTVTTFNGTPTWMSELSRKLIANLQSHMMHLPPGMTEEEFAKKPPEEQKRLQEEVAESRRYKGPTLAPFQAIQKELLGKFDPNAEGGRGGFTKGLIQEELGNPTYNENYNTANAALKKQLNNTALTDQIRGYLSNATADPMVQAARYVGAIGTPHIDQLRQQVSRALTENILPRVNDEFIASGNYGGTKHMKTSDRMMRNALNELTDKSHSYLADLYNTGLSASHQGAQHQLAAASVAGPTASEQERLKQEASKNLTAATTQQRTSNQEAHRAALGAGATQQGHIQEAQNEAAAKHATSANQLPNNVILMTNLLKQQQVPTIQESVAHGTVKPGVASGATTAGNLVAGFNHGGYIGHYADGGYVTDVNNNMTRDYQVPFVNTNQGNFSNQPMQQPMQPQPMQVPQNSSNSYNPNIWQQPNENATLNTPQNLQAFATFDSSVGKQLPQEPQITQTPQAPRENYAHGGHISNLRHYASGGELTPTQKGSNTAFDTSKLLQEVFGELRNPKETSLSDHVRGAAFEGAANLTPGRGWIGNIANILNLAHKSQEKANEANEAKKMQGNKMLEFIHEGQEARKRHEEQMALRNKELEKELEADRAHKHSALALDREYKMGMLDLERMKSNREETPEQKRRYEVISKQESKDLEQMTNTADASQGLLEKVDLMKDLVGKVGRTGPGMLGMEWKDHPRLATFGTEEGTLANREEFAGLASRELVSLMEKIKGVQSDRDMMEWKNAIPGLDKTPEGNMKLLDFYEKAAKRAIEANDYISKRYEEGVPFAQAKKEWREMANKSSLWDETNSSSPEKADTSRESRLAQIEKNLEMMREQLAG